MKVKNTIWIHKKDSDGIFLQKNKESLKFAGDSADKYM